MSKRYDLFDGGSHETIEVDSMADAEDKARDWALGGEWGDNGATVDVWIREIVSEPDADRDEYGDESSVSVDIEAIEPDCDDDCEHDLRADPTDGCSENPGVWSLGGTTLRTVVYCLRCGKRRIETDRGTQRNPGEARVSVEWETAHEYGDDDGDTLRRLREHYDWTE